MVEVASILANASFASTTSVVCGALIQQSASVSLFVLWTFVEGLSRRRTRAVLRRVPERGRVHEFSSPAVKPGYGLMISSGVSSGGRAALVPEGARRRFLGARGAGSRGRPVPGGFPGDGG